VEYCVNIITPFPDRVDPMRITEAVKAVDAERCIMSSDLGQSYNPAPAEGLRMAIATMLRYQLTEKEIELMIKTNPAKLLGLD
jgi:predicted TIM-barrel fold metal-dependent hydrolase